MVLWILQQHGVITKILTTLNYKPGITKNHTPSADVSDVTPKQKRNVCTDDHLFNRASELNHVSPLSLTGSETEIELKTTQTTLNTDTNFSDN